MIKKIKRKLKMMNNRGSSLVLVIVSTTFLSVLVSALLMGMLLAYRLKFYKLNSLNNFYAVEQAMDESIFTMPIQQPLSLLLPMIQINSSI